MRVQVIGDGLLAETTRMCCLPYFELADAPDVLWVCKSNRAPDPKGST